LKTPKEYNDNLKKGIITKAMLEDCLFSVNKRAKNCRDKELEIRDYYRFSRYAYDKYHNEDKYRNQKKGYYKQKEVLLSIISPDCIHVETQIRRQRVYDYESEYSTYNQLYKVLHENSYWDRDIDREVYFYDVEMPVDRYYLFYDFGVHSFHTPIDDESKLENYSNLEKIHIDSLNTHGEDISELVSTQFVAKVIKLIDSQQYQYIDKGDN
jgi:hypothetical protein